MRLEKVDRHAFDQLLDDSGDELVTAVSMSRLYNDDWFQQNKLEMSYIYQDMVAEAILAQNYKKALEYAIHCYRILSETLPSFHPETARALYCIADIYYVLGNYVMAAAISGTSGYIFERVLGKNNLEAILCEKLYKKAKRKADTNYWFNQRKNRLHNSKRPLPTSQRLWPFKKQTMRCAWSSKIRLPW